MPSKLKTALVAGTVALVAALGATQAAEAGSLRHVPFGPFNTYLPSAHDDYDDDSYLDGYGYDCCGTTVDSAAAAAVGTAASVARDVLGVTPEDIYDLADE